MRTDDLATVIEAAGQRRLELDPLLPAPQGLPGGCGTTFTVSGPSGRPVAAATCQHWTDEPGSISLTWGAARRFILTPLIAGPDVAGALDSLIVQWREHLADVESAREDDTAAVITWPSRDAGGVPALLRHGFAPLAVVAARTARPPRPTAPADPQIRRAGPADVEAVTALGVQLVRYDAQFGGVVERPETEAGLRTECEKLLAEPEPWVWLAERDGEALGVLIAERPERATWIAPLARPAPVAYLQQGFVRSGLRGAGLGARLTEHFHAAADAAGVAVTLLHYAQVNPLSVPFWSQQGYRPLRTSWEVRPARRL